MKSLKYRPHWMVLVLLMFVMVVLKAVMYSSPSSAPSEAAISQLYNLNQTYPQHPFAVVSLLSTEGWHGQIFQTYKQYVRGLKKLAFSMRHEVLGSSNSTSQSSSLDFDMVLLVLDTSGYITPFQKQRLHMAGWNVIRNIHKGIASPIKSTSVFESALKRITSGRYDTSEMFTKLYLWTLVEYEKVLYLDADTMVLKPQALNQLFQTTLSSIQQIGMVKDSSNASSYNAGVMLLKPSLELYHKMIHDMYIIIFNTFYCEQGFLNVFFKDQIISLPSGYNWEVFEFSQNLHYFSSEVFIVHFISKPWESSQCPLDKWEEALGSSGGEVPLCMVWNIIPE